MTGSIWSISKLRYDTLAGYTRRLGADVLSEELAWYEASNGRVVGTLIRDTRDDDFGGIIVGRDEKGCFRCVEVTLFCVSPEIASNWLKMRMHEWSTKPPCDFAQGDATGNALNVFTPIVAAHKLSPAFVRVAMEEQFSPARTLIESMMPYYEDVDGNFVEQFQSSAFDARFWELYVFALLTEERFVFDRTHSAPDFLCEGLHQDIFVEEWLGCFSENDLREDEELLKKIPFLKESKISVSGSGSSRDFGFHFRSNPIPIVKVTVHGYGLIAGLSEVDVPPLAIHAGDTYSTSQTSRQAESLKNAYEKADRQLKVFVDVGVTPKGEATLDFSLLAYPDDIVYVGDKAYDVTSKWNGPYVRD
jgi:hypothetical protein